MSTSKIDGNRTSQARRSTRRSSSALLSRAAIRMGRGRPRRPLPSSSFLPSARHHVQRSAAARRHARRPDNYDGGASLPFEPAGAGGVDVAGRSRRRILIGILGALAKDESRERSVGGASSPAGASPLAGSALAGALALGFGFGFGLGFGFALGFGPGAAGAAAVGAGADDGAAEAAGGAPAAAACRALALARFDVGAAEGAAAPASGVPGTGAAPGAVSGTRALPFLGPNLARSSLFCFLVSAANSAAERPAAAQTAPSSGLSDTLGPAAGAALGAGAPALGAGELAAASGGPPFGPAPCFPRPPAPSRCLSRTNWTSGVSTASAFVSGRARGSEAGDSVSVASNAWNSGTA